MRGYPTVLILLFSVSFLLPGPAAARPLDKKDCTALSAQRAKLAKKGIEKAIVKGPEWTSANMPAEILDQVRRYLLIEEKLRFRCQGFKLPALAPEQTAAAAADADARQALPDKAEGAAAKKDISPVAAPAKPDTPLQKEKTAARKGAVTQSPAATPAASQVTDTATLPSSDVPLPDQKPRPGTARARAPKKKKRPAATVPETQPQFSSDGS